MNNLTLSYSLTLPQSIYPNLNYLMSINKRQIKSWLNTLWNYETLNRLKQKGQAVSILKQTVKKTENWIPSRVYRNSLEQTGQILRSQIERKEIYEYIVNHPCTAVYDENCLADHLKKSPVHTERAEANKETDKKGIHRKRLSQSSKTRLQRKRIHNISR